MKGDAFADIGLKTAYVTGLLANLAGAGLAFAHGWTCTAIAGALIPPGGLILGALALLGAL